MKPTSAHITTVADAVAKLRANGAAAEDAVGALLVIAATVARSNGFTVENFMTGALDSWVAANTAIALVAKEDAAKRKAGS